MMPEAELVEILVIVEDAQHAAPIMLDALHLDRALRSSAIAMVDTCTLTTPRKAVIIRLRRSDFDAAVDRLLPMLQAFRDRWHGRARIVMESKGATTSGRNRIARLLS